jgi:hypothetical protein
MKPLTGLVRALLISFGVGAVAAFVLYRIGAPVEWAVLIALPIAALVLLMARLPRATDIAWSPLPGHQSTATSVQAATLASRLDEASRDQDRFASRVQPRLRQLALARLRQNHGIATLDETLLGPVAYRLLTDPNAAMPNPRALAEVLDRLETL